MDLIGLYEEVYDLLENKCKQDPPSDPYKSKYEARKKLEAMKCILIVELETSSEDEKQAWKKAQFAAVLLHIGIISLETEELSVGQEHLQKVVDFTSGFEMSPRCICLAVLCYNNLAVLFAHLDKQGFEVLESLHTLTLYYLAQVMGKLGDHIASAKLCLTTLHRQLSSGEYHTSSWAVNAATLAKFYQDNNKFGVARRLLAAAWTLLDDYHAENSVEDSKSSEHLGEDSNEKLLEAKAEVNRRFGMYCVSLMQESYNVLSEENPKEEMSENKEDSSEDKCLEQEK
ncbi:Protein KBP-like protein [Armadillidium vulgare]|nr:Protein KBP-like protein [Armadillidium vulgare]